MDQELFEQFMLKRGRIFKVGGYEGFSDADSHYLVVPVDELTQEELQEIKQVTDVLYQNGDASIGMIRPSKTNNLSVLIDGRESIVVQYPLQLQRVGRWGIGEQLALFHLNTRAMVGEVTQLNRYGNWKEYWSDRIDFHEEWHQKMLTNQRTSFDEAFVKSFPYFAGLAENAIQYVVDTDLDEERGPMDQPTVTHRRFHRGSWLGDGAMKPPHQIVIDHPSRDAAEWIRASFFQHHQRSSRDMVTFLQQYNQQAPLSRYGWRLLYGRLIFPLHYFESVEGYYNSHSEEERNFYEGMHRWVTNSAGQYEAFLRDFYDMLRLQGLPKLDWLEEREQRGTVAR